LFHKIKALNALILGHVIQEAALWVAEEFEVENVQASSGCSDSFNKRSVISQRILSGESNEESQDAVKSVNENLVKLFQA
jgi:hypothetical protein